jgi:hypothetical protein
MLVDYLAPARAGQYVANARRPTAVSLGGLWCSPAVPWVAGTAPQARWSSRPY